MDYSQKVSLNLLTLINRCGSALKKEDILDSGSASQLESVHMGAIHDVGPNHIDSIYINSIHARSQDVTPGGLFVAVPGFVADGHDYILDAIQRGAVAVVVQKDVEVSVPVIRVKNTRKALAALSAAFYGNPSDKMTLVGITGTNGKTTTTWILESIFRAAGFETGVIGTVNWRFKGVSFDNPVTTPESLDLQKMFARMAAAGVTHVVMEVSSHALDLHRVHGCVFDVGVFTNLTQDHLDYHQDMESYFECKKSFFTDILPQSRGDKPSVAVINSDDSWGRRLQNCLKGRSFLTGKSMSGDITAQNITDEISGLSGYLVVAGEEFSFVSGLTGGFNLENILSAAGAAHSLGISSMIIKKGIENLPGVPGRLERVEPSFDRHVFVDYAHTPDALESVLETLAGRAVGRVISVVGCGGDRDRAKRPLMGEIATRLSTLAVITSDNPRSEEPSVIIQDILTGVSGKKGCEYNSRELESEWTTRGYVVEPDRGRALMLAVKASRPGDIILAAGKGHETYQVLKDKTIDFDDRQILKDALACLEIIHA